MPKVTEAHIEARRAQIIGAACECFINKGFHQTTIRDICAAAGLSAGAVYGYFKSKEELVEAMAEMGRQNTRALLGPIDRQKPAPRALANELANAVSGLDTEGGAASTRLDLQLWGEALHSPQLRRLFLEAFENVKEPFAELVRDGQKRREINKKLDPDAAARVMSAICLGFVVQKAMEPDADYSGFVEVVSALLEGNFAKHRSAR